MSVTVRIPLVLARLTDGQKEVQIEASNIREMVDSLETAYPGIKARLCGEDGELRNLLTFMSTRRTSVSSNTQRRGWKMATTSPSCP